MKVIGRSLIISITVLLLTACGVASPSATVHKFYRFLDAGKAELALDLIERATVETFGREKLLAGLQKGAAQLKEKKGIKKLETHDEKIEENSAWVQIKFEYGDGDTEEAANQLVKEDGSWKLAMTKP